ncbi:hypothetical protein [Alcanivorax sp.]|uniref:hypothetical protein n=1 Tax=Alcanivorax sp. TaxID=1872427 RepID=UPI0025C616A1|nr:hypothetical protein [Alcanivorax sp.]
MAVVITETGADDVVLDQVATDGGYPVSHTGSTRNRIEKVAVAAGAGLVPAVSDSNAIVWLAGSIGGSVCYLLEPGGEDVTGVIAPADVAGHRVSVVAQVVAKDEKYGAQSESRVIDWPVNEWRRIEIKSADIFPYFSLPEGQNDDLRNTRGSGAIAIYGTSEGGGQQGYVALSYSRAYVGDAAETGGWSVSAQSNESGVIIETLSEVEGDVLAISVAGDGRLRFYVNGEPSALGDIEDVLHAGHTLTISQYIAMPFTTGSTEPQAITAGIEAATTDEESSQEYSDGSVGWCG